MFAVASRPCRRRPLRGPALAWLLAAGCLAAAAPADDTSPARRPLPVVPAGTPVEDPGRDRWNKIVLLATPRFSSGDTGDVSPSLRDTVSRFTFAILATTTATTATTAADAGAAAAPRHRLVEVGVGYGMPVNGQLTVVSPEVKQPGATLDFLGRQVLGAKHKSLAEIECVGADDTAVAFDVPTLMFRGDDHAELVVRHLVRIDPRTGECSTCAWLAAVPSAADAATAADTPPREEPLRLIEGGTREQRPIHVDGSRFRLGFPTKNAFAVEDLPPGGRIPWSPALLRIADEPAYSPAAFARLTAAVEEAIGGAGRGRAAAAPVGTTLE